MVKESPLGALSRLSARSLGVFRGHAALELGLTRKQLARLRADGVIARELPDTYRLTSVEPSSMQRLHAALLWAGDDAAAAGRSAACSYGLEGIRAEMPEIVVPYSTRARTESVIVHRTKDLSALMIRRHRGIRCVGVEAALITLARTLDGEALEIACEDARRRELTSVSALHAYLSRHGHSGRAGVATIRRLLADLDPVHPSRSTLEVKTRRLLVAHGISDFVREFPLESNGRMYYFDFCFERRRAILEANGRRWHDDPTDYEHDNEKWSVPARYGYRIVFATWDKVTRHPGKLIDELLETLAA